jgi:hypothetical protein
VGGSAKLAPMAPSLLTSGLLLLAFFLGPFGVYAFTLGRLNRGLPAFLAGSACLLVLTGVALMMVPR